MKPLNQYYKHHFNNNGRDTLCKQCSREYSKRWSSNHRERKNELGRQSKARRKLQYAEAGVKLVRKPNKAPSPELKSKWLFNHRMNTYGITVETYRSMWKSQGGFCAICGEVDYDGIRLCVDHDHVTGTVRGLLCGKCNRGIGLLKDSPAVLAKAALYLEAHLHKDTEVPVSFLARLEKTDGG